MIILDLLKCGMSLMEIDWYYGFPRICRIEKKSKKQNPVFGEQY
jgi:hypothetical protein